MLRWYILRSSAANAVELAGQIQDKGLRTFVPTEYHATMIGEEKVWQQIPSQPDLLFVYGTYDDIRTNINHPGINTLRFVHETEDHQQNVPLTIRDEEMENLIHLVSVSIPQSYSVTDAEIHYRPGGPVRITDGPFKDVIGRVARIHTQTRVVVTIPGIISYATTYIPKHQMQPIDDND